MSDDFDKNKPLWDDDEEETPGDDQDESFDWQTDDDESQPADRDRLGFTGELPWMGEDDAGDQPGQRPNRLGLTGELPWLQGQDDGTPGSGDDDDLLPWQRDAARRVEMETGDLSTPPVDEPPDAEADQPWSGRHVTADLDVPDWMRDTGPDFDSPSPDDEEAETPAPPVQQWLDADEPADEIETEVPDWMRDFEQASGDSEDEAAAGEDEALPVPDWLTGDDPLDMLSQPLAEDEIPAPPLRDASEDSPDWLRKIDTSQFGSGEDEPLPVPDWLQDDDDISPPAAEEDPLAAVPDWLTAEEPEPEPEEVFDPYDTSFGLDDDLPPTGSLPQAGEVDFDFGDWQADEAAEEAPGWLQEVEAESALETEDALAWLDDDLLAEEAVDPDPTQPSDPTGPLVDRSTEEAPDEEASSELEDYFSVVEVEELPPVDAEVMAEEQPPEPVALDDDFFAALGGDESTAEPAYDDADDFFAALETTEATDDMPEPDFADFGIDEAAPEPERPAPAPLGDDFFASLGIDTGDEAEESAAEPDFEALFTEDVSDEDEAPAFFDADQIPDGEFLSSLGIHDEEDEAPVDWFAEEESAAEPEAGWLDELGDLPEPGSEPTDEAAQLQADFLASLDDMDFMEAAQETAAPAESYGDIDSILAAMDTEEARLPDSSELVDPYADFDTLLTDPAFADVQPAREDERTTSQDDWLTEMGATVGSTSAAALVRQQQDRPLDDLPERLRRLRDRAEETAATPRPEVESSALDNLLPGVSNALSPGVFEVDVTGIASAITITPDQQRRVDLLRSLAASEASVERPTRSAIDATYDADLLDDEAFAELMGEDAEAAPQPVAALPVAAPRERRRIRIDRLLISLLLAAAVIIPFFVDNVRIGQPPPARFAAGSPEEAAFAVINSLPPGALVLVGVEYGPTSAAELDGLTRVLLRHILLREARPVIVSGSPVALLRADNILAEMSAAGGWQPNQDYFVVRYLPGGNIGLRSLSGNTAPLLANDLRGQLTGLEVTGLRDFTALLVITDRPEDMRNWVEQVAPLAGRPFVGASGFAAAPLAQPYVGAALTGLLVGYADALTYEQMLSAPAAAEVEATLPVIVPPTEEPTPTPTQTFTPSPEPPTATPTPPAVGVINATSAINVREGAGASFAIIASLEPGAEVEVLSLDAQNGFVNVRLPDGTEGWVSEGLIVVMPVGDVLAPPPTATAAATATQPPTTTSTPRPTNTPAPTSTPLPATTQPPPATNTPAPTAMPTSSPTPVPTVITARVTASERVNIRSGPGIGFTPVGTAGFGDTFIVIGRNGAGDWIQIEFGDAEQAWIAAFLVEVSAAEADDSSSAPAGITLLTGGGLRLAPYVAQAETTPEAEVTAEADDDSAPPAVDDAPTLAGDDLARWYSMNLGLAAIIAIIILGALVNIGRALLRRRG